MANVIQIMNTILENASQEYQNRVPEATQTNIEEVGNPILKYQTVQNEFITTLIDRIGLVVVHNKIAQNPLAILKKGSMPLGKDIQEIFVNPAKAETFDPEGKDLLKRYIPDVKVLYHRENRRDQYPVTISREMLKTAFTSWEELDQLVSSIINSLYSGDNYDEFILTKNLMAHAIKNDNIKKVIVENYGTTNDTTSLVKCINNVSSSMVFPSSNFNTYYDVINKEEIVDENPVITWTPREDQVLIIRSDVLTDVKIDVLATAFNMEKADLLAQTLAVDTIGDTGAYAILCDKSWITVKDTLSELTEFYNAKGMHWNYYWNHWQTYSYSLFANAVAFVPPTDEEGGEEEGGEE